MVNVALKLVGMILLYKVLGIWVPAGTLSGTSRGSPS